MTLKRANFLIFLAEISENGRVCHVFFSLPFVCVCVCVFQTKVRFCRRIGALLLFWLCAVTLVPLQSDCFLFSWCRIWLFLRRFVSSDFHCVSSYRLFAFFLSLLPSWRFLAQLFFWAVIPPADFSLFLQLFQTRRFILFFLWCFWAPLISFVWLICFIDQIKTVKIRPNFIL